MIEKSVNAAAWNEEIMKLAPCFPNHHCGGPPVSNHNITTEEISIIGEEEYILIIDYNLNQRTVCF
jgi:hypothetical protein